MVLHRKACETWGTETREVGGIPSVGTATVVATAWLVDDGWKGRGIMVVDGAKVRVNEFEWSGDADSPSDALKEIFAGAGRQLGELYHLATKKTIPFPVELL